MMRSLSLFVGLLLALAGCTGGPGPLPDDQTSGTGSAERPPTTGESGNPRDERDPTVDGPQRGPDPDDSDRDDDRDDDVPDDDRDGG